MTEPVPLSLGFSPCPNDTYIFHALVHGRVALGSIAFAEPLLEDVETLNLWAMEARLDVTKLSFHAFGHVQDRYRLLTAGAALGRGCGPLLVSGSAAKPANLAEWRIAIPGSYTTAALLLRLYRPDCRLLFPMRFDRIMEVVRSGEVDAGVIIHESRFTYDQWGLGCVEDLGEWWERTTGLPIPLGCIAVRNSLAKPLQEEVNEAIAASIRWAVEHPQESEPYIREHARELAPEVTRSHIALYVNDFSRDLGEEGLLAVGEFLRRGGEAGLFSRQS